MEQRPSSRPAMSAAAVFGELAKRHGQPTADRRRHVRRDWPTPVSVAWMEGQERVVLQTLAHGISETGCCFFSTCGPPGGSEVTVTFHELEGSPEVRGLVRHTVPVSWTFHRTGLEFPS